MDRIEEKIVAKKEIVYCVMFAVALFMHFYKLADVPYGLHIDEAGMAYDAFCLANYSVDRYLNHLPVYLINFGGGQSALNAYLVAILIKLTGTVNTWIIRFPGAILAIFSYIAGVNIIRKTCGEKWGMVSAFFLAIFPYFTMQSRFGLDCNLLLGMTTIGLYFLLKAQEKKKTFLYILTGIIWGISFYTYALSYIANTLFLGVLLIYWLYMKKITWKHVFCFGIPILFIVSPLLLMIIINTFDMPQINTPLFTIPRLPGYRKSDIIFTNMWNNLWVTIRSILTKDWLPYNAFDKYFTMYRLSIVFAVVGAVRLMIDSLKHFIKKEYFAHNIFLMLFITHIFLGMIIGDDGPNINRLNGIFFAQFFCVMYGVKYLYSLLKRCMLQNRNKENLMGLLSGYQNIEKKIAFSVIILYGFYFLTFANYYFREYAETDFTQEYFADTYKDIIDFIETSTGEPKVVYTNTSYIYYFLSELLDPYEADIRQNGTRSYWKYVFNLPDTMEMDVIYIFNNTDEGINQLMETIEGYGFEKYESGMLTCYYKK